MSTGDVEKALQILEKVSKTNNRKISDKLNKNHYIFNNSLNKNIESEVKRISALNIFKLPEMRKRTIILAFCWFFLFISYHTNTQNSTNLGSDIYYSFSFGALVEIPAILFVFLTLDRFGRKLPMSLSMLLSAVVGFSSLLLNANQLSANYYLISSLIMRVCLATEYNIIVQYSTEVYPTVLRGHALAFLRFIGTLGLYISPSIV